MADHFSNILCRIAYDNKMIASSSLSFGRVESDFLDEGAVDGDDLWHDAGVFVETVCDEGDCAWVSGSVIQSICDRIGWGRVGGREISCIL